MEGDEGIADFLRLELEHEGYGVIHAADGRSALELFERDTPDTGILAVKEKEVRITSWWKGRFILSGTDSTA